MSKVLIHQPEYLPWTNLFLKMNLCDTYVFLDNVQYQRRSYQNRNLIVQNSNSLYLTVPLEYCPRDTLIKDVKIDYEKNWIEEHLKKIKFSYSKSEFYNDVLSILKKSYFKKFKYLNELNQSLIISISQKLKIQCNFYSSSNLKVRGSKSELILNICKNLNASEYITGVGSKNYLNEKEFINNFIKIKFIPPKNLIYKQINSKNKFIKDMSIVDYLFNMGFKNYQSMKV